MLGKFTGKLVEGAQNFTALWRPDPVAPRSQSRLRTWFKFPKLDNFNFILLHYSYLIIMTMIGSILLYPAGGLRYIDALFFAAGSSTQSGLNTIDVNRLRTYQQICLVLFAALCNPIVINTFVVFVRLYWFEKRFQGVVTQARTMRGRTISRRASDVNNEPDFGREETGIGSRRKRLYRPFDGKSAANDHTATSGVENEKTSEDSGHPETDDDIALPSATQAPFRRDIMFADEVKGSDPELSNDERVPEQRPAEQHIAFVENQRNPKDNTALYIPGPRDVERGYGPQRIQEGDSASEVDEHAAPPEDGNSPVEHRTNPFKSRFISSLSGYAKPKQDSESPTTLRSRVAKSTRSFGRHSSHDRTGHDLPYLSYSVTIGRNSTFVDLTEEQREELGGIEYRALKTLAWILIIYYIGFFVISFLILVPWIVNNKKYSAVVREDGQSPTWWGFFTAMSMFTDLGFTLTPDSMISFNQATLPLLLGTFLIIIGNTGFPVLLRFIIWVATKCVPYGTGVWEELRFLLDHPRRCFTLLFPTRANWWLFGILILLNGVDLIFFVILDLDDPTVTSLPRGFQFLDGLFQAASTRTAGFAAVNLADLHPGIQVSYLVMMYISVYPIAISVRQTNVYEEKSLGVYGNDDESVGGDPNSVSYLGSHLRRQLSFDLWFVFLGLFFITIIEGDRIADVNESSFTIFSLLFEIVSAYGTVGLSLGYPGKNASFSGEFHTLSKLIIISMMIRGRHRGLPYALDRAILLPSESLRRKEAEMAIQRRERRASFTSARTGGDGTSSQMPPRIGDLAAPTATSRMSEMRRSRSRTGLTKIVTNVFSAGPASVHKHHHHNA